MNRSISWGVASLAILLRLLVFWQIDLPTGGTAYYYETVAQSLLRGDGFVYRPYVLLDRNLMVPKTFESIPLGLESAGVDLSADTRYAIEAPLYRYPPAYPVFLAACHFLFGPSPAPVVWVEIFLNGLVAAMIYRLALYYFDNVLVAAGAGILAAVWPFTLINSLSYEPTSLLYATVIGSVAALTEFQKTGRTKFLVFSAILGGISALLRTDALFATFGLAMALLLSKSESFGHRTVRMALYLFLTAAVMSPWLIRNAMVFHRFVPLSCGLGVNLVIGIGKYIPDSGFPADDRSMIYRELGTELFTDKMHTDDGCYPDGIEREQKRTKQATDYIREHPFKFLRSCIARAPDLFFVGAATVRNQTGAHRSGWRRAAAVGLTGLEPFFLGMAFLGLIRSRDCWPKMSAAILTILFYIVGHLPMWVEPRYFKPVWPLLLLFSAAVFLGRKKFRLKS